MARQPQRNQRPPPAVEKRARLDAMVGPDEGPAGRWQRILARRLRGRLSEEVELTLTDNIHTMVSYARRGGRCRIRLHHMFLQAPPAVVDAVARYVAGEARGSEALDTFIHRHQDLIRPVSRPQRQRRLRVRPEGSHHDLQRLFDGLNTRFFEGRVRALVGWATVPRVRARRRSIKLGSYSEKTGVIRIHPALDHSWVPAYVVASVVFHEMLHVVEPARVVGRRRIVHTPAFLVRERAFPDLARARAWEREHIDWLLSWGVQPAAL